MQKVRFGIIGCGTVAGYGHVPGILSCANAELVAISDLNEVRLAEFRAKYGIECTYTDYRDLLARDDIEAVGVAVPIGSHYGVVMDAVAAGKHILCEKPIAPTLVEGEKMVRAASDAGKLLSINFELRVSDPMPEMKRLLDSGAIGDLKVIRCVVNWAGGRWAGDDRYRMLITEGLGPMVDSGTHHFDLARWFSGSEIAEIQATGTYVEDWPNPDHVIATCKMENGVLLVNENSWCCTHTTPRHESNLRYELIGTDGLLSWVDWQTSIEGSGNIREFSVYSRSRCTRGPVARYGKAFDRQYSLFARSIREGELSPDLASGHDGVQALRAALEALRLAR